MGRGRQKAKQTKVARKLKYMSPDTDYRALEHELQSGPVDVATHADSSFEDGYADDYGRVRDDKR